MPTAGGLRKVAAMVGFAHPVPLDAADARHQHRETVLPVMTQVPGQERIGHEAQAVHILPTTR